jgi:transcriptional regulator with XRE-family HTH domain
MISSFGEALREARRAAGVSQRELAERVGLDFSYISKVENSRVSPPAADTVVAISRTLGISPEHLLALIGKLPTPVQQTVSSSVEAQRFLAAAQRLGITDAEWEKLTHHLLRLRGENPCGGR